MRSLSREKAELLQLLAARIVPETVELDAAGLSRFFAIIDHALQKRPASVRRQFATFLGVLRWVPFLRFGSPIEKLRGDHQDAVLRSFEDSPVGLLRKGFWSLKAMVYMGYYGQSETHRLVGYKPEFDGRAKLDA